MTCVKGEKRDHEWGYFSGVRIDTQGRRVDYGARGSNVRLGTDDVTVPLTVVRHVEDSSRPGTPLFLSAFGPSDLGRHSGQWLISDYHVRSCRKRVHSPRSPCLSHPNPRSRVYRLNPMDSSVSPSRTESYYSYTVHSTPSY